MAKKIEIYQIDAFTKNSFEGNPAGVTYGDGLSREEMQSIASEMNLSETAFISASDKADYKLQWFTPADEIKLCGHATIASLHFLNEHNKIKENETVKFETLSGILNCDYYNGKYRMQIPLYEMKEYEEDKNELMDILGISDSMMDNSVPWLLLENGNLYIHLKKLDDVKNLKPDFKRLKKLSGTVEGVVVFTLETIDKEDFAFSRYFVPAFGIDEDPVTGSTNGPLINVLTRLGFVKELTDPLTLTFEQGDFLKRKGRITVSYSDKTKELYIAGNAITVIKGELSF